MRENEKPTLLTRRQILASSLAIASAIPFLSTTRAAAAPEPRTAGLRLTAGTRTLAVNGKPAKVPANSYFVMGDDRDNSLDGRAWGFVPRDLIIGRAMFVYWSYDETQPFGPIEFFTNTRWRRTGTMVR